MRKIFTFIAAALFATSLWAEDYTLTAPIFADYGTARSVISKDLSGFGTLYYAAHSTTGKFDVSGGGNTYNNCYRTPKGVIVFEMPRAGKVTLKNSASSNSRTVTLHLYQIIDETAYMVFQKASATSFSIDVWLNANCKTELAADGVTTMEQYFLDLGFKKSNKTIATGSDNQKNLIPDLSQGTPVTTAGQNLYSSFWAPAEAISVPRYELTTIEINDGKNLPAGKYLLGLNDSGSSVGIYEITFSLTPATFALAFDANGHGIAPDTIKNLKKDSIPVKPTDPSETGWIFDGWYTESACTNAWTWGTSKVTQDTTLYAKWTEDTSITKYTVTYNLNGAPGDAPTQADAAEGAVITLAAEPTWANHIFDGWKCNIDDVDYAGGAQYTMTAANTTFTAQWTELFTVTYYDGAAVMGTEQVEKNAAATASEIKTDKDLFTFDGWYSDNALTEPVTLASTTITKDTAFYAKYHVTKYATSVDFVDFIANSGTDYASYLSTNGYLLKSTTGVSLDNANPFDTGLKLKENAGNTIKFAVEAKKKITLTVGKINGMTIKINDAAATAIASGSDASNLGVSVYESDDEQIVTITETATKYNMIKSIAITDKGAATALDNTEAEVKAVKVLRDGQMLIIKNGVTYTITGAVVK